MGKPEIETTNLDIIIEKIRKDGIEAAEKEGLRIREEARIEAQRIISEANTAAEKMISQAEGKIAKKENLSRKALSFAVRDSILAVKAYLEKFSCALLRNTCSESLDPQFLKTIILKVIERWPDEASSANLEILVSEKDLNELKTAFLSALSGEVPRGIEIKPVSTLSAGFRIYASGDNHYHDFSDESIAEILQFFLSSEISGIINIDEGAA